MSPKKKRGVQFKTKRIPRTARWKAKFRKWASSIWADVRGKNKGKTEKTASKWVTWPVCELCGQKTPPWIFDKCEEHPGTCSCCCRPSAPPQGGPRKKARPDQFKPGDPGRQGHKTEKEQHEDQQAEYQAEIVEQARQETQEQGSEVTNTEATDGGEQ